MKKNISIVLAWLITALTYHTGYAQNRKCPDLKIETVTVDTVASSNPRLARLRFDVIVSNIGNAIYDSAGAYPPPRINLSFSGPGYTDRRMASQPLQVPYGPHSWNQTLRFEVNVNRATLTLPDWENIALPTSYCGYITTDKVPRNYECTLDNNRACFNDRDIKRLLTIKK